MINKKYLLVLFLVLGVSQGIAETPFYGRFAITQGDARVGEKFTLTLTIKALIDLPDIAVQEEI